MSEAIACFLVERLVDDDLPARWRRVGTDEIFAGVMELPAGAMWDADWMSTAARSVDGRCIVVRLPNGLDWVIDSQASNCTRPGEEHDCWCRHGAPPLLTVDKVPEPGRSTCAAGAGSIASGKGDCYWHGFLRGGQLVTA